VNLPETLMIVRSVSSASVLAYLIARRTTSLGEGTIDPCRLKVADVPQDSPAGMETILFASPTLPILRLVSWMAISIKLKEADPLSSVAIGKSDSLCKASIGSVARLAGCAS
jgi:hypothetical protein